MRYWRSRTRLSSRGQVVIPKDIRESLGLREGQELDVFVEGMVVHLMPVGAMGTIPDQEEKGAVLKEDPVGYTVKSGGSRQTPPAAELVRRVKAVNRLRQLRGQLAGRIVDWESLWKQSQGDRK